MAKPLKGRALLESIFRDICQSQAEYELSWSDSLLLQKKKLGETELCDAVSQLLGQMTGKIKHSIKERTDLKQNLKEFEEALTAETATRKNVEAINAKQAQKIQSLETSLADLQQQYANLQAASEAAIKNLEDHFSAFRAKANAELEVVTSHRDSMTKDLAEATKQSEEAIDALEKQKLEVEELRPYIEKYHRVSRELVKQSAQLRVLQEVSHKYLAYISHSVMLKQSTLAELRESVEKVNTAVLDCTLAEAKWREDSQLNSNDILPYTHVARKGPTATTTTRAHTTANTKRALR
eukprot:GILI01019720.1.p1 GENE.GILI01019720.1~~GILI01019720.1.p1  ORF type:complete len:295 (-),score=27.64 GILI01019720.1:39-923(-)